MHPVPGIAGATVYQVTGYQPTALLARP